MGLKRAEAVDIIGAGVCGLCVATELVDHDIEVCVHDRASALGPDACSWWAGGMLAPWCEREMAEAPVTRLGADAADWWDRHAGGVVRAGTVICALSRDRRELDRFARRTERCEWLDTGEIEALEPDLAGRVSRALFFPEEAHLTPRLALRALIDGLVTRGATVSFGSEPETDKPDTLTVDCRGLSAREALTDLRGVKGEMLVLKSSDVELNRPVRLLHPRIPLYVVPRGDQHFMIGATSIESDERTRVSARSLLELLGGAYALHPAFGEAEVVEIGVDARPAFPDNLPRLRRQGNRLYANGLYRHGFLLAPAVAKMVTRHVLNPQHVPEWMDEHRL
jgi:glycine oxidase